MDITVTRPVTGGPVEIIPSKSVAHRLLMAASLSDAPCSIEIRETSQDIEATRACLKALMSPTPDSPEALRVTNPVALADGESVAPRIMKCGESGSTFRFMIPLCGVLGASCDFYPEGRLPERPLSPMYEELEAHGMKMSSVGAVPFHVEGRLTGGDYTIEGNVSSQYITALLMALPLAEEDSRLKIVGKLESAPYVNITLDVLRQSGIEIGIRDWGYEIPGGQTYHLQGNIPVEGDWSGAAFWVAQSMFVPMELSNLNPDSSQGDKAIVDMVRTISAAGADETVVMDVTDTPDLVPAIAVAAAGADCITRVVGASRLRIKESDRLESVSRGMRSLGADVVLENDDMIITGCGYRSGGRLTGGTCDSMADHRIAMMAASAALLCANPVTVTGAEAVRKSYPGFWEDYEKLGGELVRR